MTHAKRYGKRHAVNISRRRRIRRIHVPVRIKPNHADLIVLFGHPRLLPELPSNGPVLLAWHRQRLMQEAVGRWLHRRVG